MSAPSSLLRLVAGLFLFTTAGLQAAESKPFKVLTYNVLYGFNYQKSTDLGAEWIKGQ